MTNQNLDQLDNIPYKEVLIKIIDKITNEFFLFLTGYMILVIGFALLAPDILDTLKVILYLIIGLGGIGYIFSRKSNYRKQISSLISSVRVFSVSESGDIAGVEGLNDLTNISTEIKAGFVKGKIRGIVAGKSKEDVQIDYLVSLFSSLDESAKKQVISYTTRI